MSSHDGLFCYVLCQHFALVISRWLLTQRKKTVHYQMGRLLFYHALIYCSSLMDDLFAKQLSIQKIIIHQNINLSLQTATVTSQQII